MKNTMLLALLVCVVACGKAKNMDMATELPQQPQQESITIPAQIELTKTYNLYHEKGMALGAYLLGQKEIELSKCVPVFDIDYTYMYKIVSETGSDPKLILTSIVDGQTLTSMFWKSTTEQGLKGGLWRRYDNFKGPRAQKTTTLEFTDNEVKVSVTCDVGSV